MQNGEFMKGAAIGLFGGVVITGFLTRKFVREFLKESELIAERNQRIFNHLVESLGPYAPQDVLDENVNFIKFQSIVKEEKGRS